jgi:hypothetical protein
MIKTKIAFDEIQAGDLLESVGKHDGVKVVVTGIAFVFEKNFLGPEMDAWKTSENGLLVVSGDEDTIYRIDVKEASFEDIGAGDLIRVTVTIDDVDFVMTAKAHTLRKADAEWYDNWQSEQGHPIVHRNYRDTKIEILERGGE